jgi:hypothetical protein
MRTRHLWLPVCAMLAFGCATKGGNAQPGPPPSLNDTLARGTRADSSSPAQAQLAVGLVDGTRLIGHTTRRVFAIQTPYMKTDIPVDLVVSLERDSHSGPFTINLSNGDRIQGTLSFDALELETLVGTLSIPLAKVTSLTMLRESSSATNGLAAFYPFKGSADDKSGHDRNGVLHGPTLTSDRHGLANSAYLFTGSAAYIQIPDVLFTPSASGFTVCAWVLAGDISQRCMAVYTGTRMGESMLQVDQGNICFLTKLADGSWHAAAAPAVQGKFVFLVGVYQRGTCLQLWVNGERKSETPIPDLALYGGPPVASSAIGAYWPEGLNFVWRGVIDDVRIYDRSLSETEIRSLYAAEK